MRLTLDNEPELREAQAALFNINAPGGSWILLSYVGPSTVHLASGGSDSVEQVRWQFEDDQIQYAMLRLDVSGQTGNEKIRVLFVQWTGPGVGIIEKTKKTAHVGDAQALLQPFHRDVYVTNRQRFDTKT